MKRWMVLGATGLLGASLAGATLAAHADDNAQKSGGNQQGSQANTPKKEGESYEGLPGLRRILSSVHGELSSEHFDQFLGAEFKFKDKDGKAVTLDAFPGVVKAVTHSSITLTLNDGSGDKTFTFTDPGKRVQRLLEMLKAGDKAAVVTVNGGAKAIVVPWPHKKNPEVKREELQKRIEQRLDQLNKHEDQLQDRLKKQRERIEQQIKKLQEQLQQGQAPTPAPSA